MLTVSVRTRKEKVARGGRLGEIWGLVGAPYLVIVRHGEGRGRIPGYLDPVFARIERTSPALHARLRFHFTGRRAPSLEGAGAIVFLLADPLRERYPDCYHEALAIAALARAAGIPVLNPPEALSNTIKSVQSERWRAAGIPTPPVHRFANRDELRALAGRVEFPVLIRSDELHAQQGMRVCARARALERIPESELRYPGAVSPLFDVRLGYRARDPKSVFARFFHKKRLLVLGGRIRTKHVFFARGPIVTSQSCTFHGSYRFSRLARLSPTLRACAAEDLAYWTRGTEHEKLMQRASGALGLNFVAIDYISLADDSLMLWEANPYPYLPDLSDMLAESWRWAEERVTSYYDAIGRFLADAIA